MSSKKSFLLFLFITFDLLLLPTFGANSSALLYEVEPYIRVYRNGTVERLFGTDFVPSTLDPKSRVLSKDITFDKKFNISARLFRPNSAAAAAKLPLFVYFHGGAFFTESPFSPTYNNYMNTIVPQANIISVSVNYRLAPEHPLPIGYQDSWAALKWVFSHKEGKGEESWLRDYVDFTRVYLGGDSAGGNIAHNVAMRVGLEGRGEGITVRGMFLNCPHFWGKKRIGNESADPVMVHLEDKQWIYANPRSNGFDDPQLNPATDPNLSKLGVKKVLVYVAENDILKDRGLYYVKTLEERKWEGVVKGVEVKGVGHVFNLNDPNTTEARRMNRHLAMFLNDKGKLE